MEVEQFEGDLGKWRQEEVQQQEMEKKDNQEGQNEVKD